ncbi:phage portal protein [Turicibacter sanguinis]|uniref:Phage portal protein n=1 Tax=Turicibacter sanguinis TaxID=154288 RepID=A0A9X4XGJ1_9FIRM|nr:phage portal protein [Phocaeicola vulgatus]MTK22235.1 phage portal protein [Turicibacter sanguinis]MTK73869.1 phage portal protein [Turicibacter sanguinis]
MPIIKDRDLLNEDGSVPIELLVKCFENHNEMKMRYEKMHRYYDGMHDILNRTLSSDQLPNNKLVCNHAEYISDMAVGYVFGTPISYTGDDSAEQLNDIFVEIDEDSHNNELALDCSICGVGYELVYMNNEVVPYPELAVLNPMSTFLVCDDTVKQKPMFGVTYSPKFDVNDTLKGYEVNVYTDREIYCYLFSNLQDRSPQEIDLDEHYFGAVPIIEYQNNKKLKGDFEGVISLIDAYNLLQSDRLNDKEQMVDALLAVVGASLGDDQDEQVETARLLKEMKIIELDAGGDAKWLVKGLNEEQTEVLKKSLKDDIHEFSKVPCLTDENFVGNTSGVAMKYKLLGFEQLGKTKERYFKKGLRQRLKLMANIENIRAKNIDTKAIDIIMKRSLPVDDELLAKIAQETEGFISWETRVQRFDSEIDIEEERKRLEEERQKSIEETQKAFGSYEFKEENEDDSDSLDSNGD